MSVCLFFLQGKVVHQSFSIQSSFTQKVRLQQIRSLTEDIRFYYKRLRNNKDELEPRRKSKVENPDWNFNKGKQCSHLSLQTQTYFHFSMFSRWQIFILTPACSVVITVMWACHLCLNVSFFWFCIFVFCVSHNFGSGIMLALFPLSSDFSLGHFVYIYFSSLPPCLWSNWNPT